MQPASDNWINIDSRPIDMSLAQEYLASESTESGATVLFLGRVREYTDPQNTGYSKQSPQIERDGKWVVHTPELIYECYPAMAIQAIQRLLADARQRWPLLRQVLHHRIGRLKAGEIAILIGVTSRHRTAAYAANEFLIEQVKQRVPVWKREIYGSGSSAWVHPLPVTNTR